MYLHACPSPPLLLSRFSLPTLPMVPSRIFWPLPQPQLLYITHSNTLCQPSSKFLRSQTSGDQHLIYHCPCRRCSPWSPGSYKLLLHVAHESEGTGPQGGLDCQAHAGMAQYSWEGTWLVSVGPRLCIRAQNPVFLHRMIYTLWIPWSYPQQTPST